VVMEGFEGDGEGRRGWGACTMGWDTLIVDSVNSTKFYVL
jgi:hypothetical protein